MMGEILEADVVVVGAGVHGSSAAYHLARDGKKTVLLEQFPLPHSRGSSHGQTRIIRRTNYGTPALSPILEDSYKQWNVIQEKVGEVLVRPYPLLVLGSKKSKDLMEKMGKSVQESGHKPQWLAPAHVNNMFGLGCKEGDMAFLDPSGGILMADKCVAAFQRLFRESGGILREEWPVTEVKVLNSESVEVRGERGTVRAKTVVLCPGAWAGPLLGKLGIHIPLKVERISVFYWKAKDPQRTKTTSFVDVDDPRGHFYGLPDIEYPGLMKLCFHGGPEVNPDHRDLVDTTEIRKLVTDYVKDKFPCLESVHVIEEACMYTTTPDTEFVLDRHPEYKNVVFAAGFSGTGFKIAPSVGRILSIMAQGQPATCDLAAFSLARFSKSKL